MNPIRMSTGLMPATGMNEATLNGVRKLHLLNEALSRARMRWPQSGTSTEATQSARLVALRARRRAERDLGTR